LIFFRHSCYASTILSVLPTFFLFLQHPCYSDYISLFFQHSPYSIEILAVSSTLPLSLADSCCVGTDHHRSNFNSFRSACRLFSAIIRSRSLPIFLSPWTLTYCQTDLEHSRRNGSETPDCRTYFPNFMPRPEASRNAPFAFRVSLTPVVYFGKLPRFRRFSMSVHLSSV
jgi:hypothetical protein